MNLEAQARYAARAAELKALGGLAPARAAALSRLALKTVVKVGVFFFFFFSKELREKERSESSSSCRASQSLRRRSDAGPIASYADQRLS